jgi:hypothetical protein
MKFLFLYIFVFFLFLSRLSGQKQEAIKISGSFKNMNFQEFVKNLETRYPIHFFYNSEWVKSIEINTEVQSVSIPELMDKLLSTSGLDYIYQSPANIFLFPDSTFVKQLPEYYYYSKKDSASLLDKSENVSGMEQKYLNGR